MIREVLRLVWGEGGAQTGVTRTVRVKGHSTSDRQQSGNDQKRGGQSINHNIDQSITKWYQSGSAHCRHAPSVLAQLAHGKAIRSGGMSSTPTIGLRYIASSTKHTNNEVKRETAHSHRLKCVKNELCTKACFFDPKCAKHMCPLMLHTYDKTGA